MRKKKSANSSLRNIAVFCVIVACLLGIKYYFSGGFSFLTERENAQTRAQKEAPANEDIEIKKDNSKEYTYIY